MSYSSSASDIRSKVSTIESNITSAKGVNLSGAWKGDSHDMLTGNLQKAYEVLNTQKANAENYAGALDMVEKYVETKNNILSLIDTYNSTPNTEENYDTRASLYEQIKSLKQSNSELKGKIQGILSSITTYSQQFERVTLSLQDIYIGSYDLDYDVDDLLYMYAGRNNPNPLRLMSNSDSLYNYYNKYDASGNLIMSGKEYVEGIITSIQQKYSGREAAVNCTLAMLQLAADAGVKMSYEHKETAGTKPYVSTEGVATGVDCNPFVSWATDKGTPNGFQWRPVGSFKSVGTTISRDSWYTAKPGDVMVNDGHVTMIVENNPEEGTLVIAHASGQTRGIILSKGTYRSYQSGGYQIQDMTNVYNGSENTNRPIFNQYVDWNTYRRPI